MISELLYTEMTIDKEQSELAKLLDCIAQVDLGHFRMLSTLLIQCGESPQYRVSRGGRADWWTGRALTYPNTSKEALAMLCKQKKGAITSYNSVIGRCRDDGIVRVLLRILADERCHLDLLSAFLARLSHAFEK